jgi:hypothetical protein
VTENKFDPKSKYLNKMKSKYIKKYFTYLNPNQPIDIYKSITKYTKYEQ